MNSFSAMQISAAGMEAQKTRVEAAALNLSNMNTSIAPGTTGFVPLRTVIHSAPASFATLFDGGAPAGALVNAQMVPQTGTTVRSVYEPGHPDADADGMVSYPGVDHTQEMITVMAALRTYEANLAALEVGKTLALKALEIGSP